MRNKVIFFLASLSLFLLASISVSAQAEFSHGFRQDIEVSVAGKGGPTLVKQGEALQINYLPKNGSVNFSVRYKSGRKYEERAVQLSVVNEKVFMPEAPGATEEASSKQVSSPSVPSAVNDRRQDQSDAYNPEVGQVNIIKNLTSDIPSFNLQLKNEAKSIGEILFIGNVFTGVAAKPDGNIITSREKVRPGLIEMAVIYKMTYTSASNISGQQFTLAQQALGYFVTDPEEVITITDNDFFDFATLASDLPIRFKNVGAPTLYPKSPNKKLKPLRKWRMSKTIKFEDARSTMWYYYDVNNVQRLAVWEIVPGDKPIIRIKAMEQLYGTAR